MQPIQNRYRPSRFSEVIGQDVSVRILQNSILMDRIPNAILFYGQYGVGKTTLARLYAKALNCDNFDGEVCGECTSCIESDNGSNQSIIELDAASHNGVDDVRLLENVTRYETTFEKTVVILDECHMLSRQAQSALLKDLEEPPENAIFLLVTTDVHKIEDPIRSRCLTMPLRSMSQKDVKESIKRILESEGMEYTEDFLKTISLNGNGSLRDAQKLLEQVSLSAGGSTLTGDLVGDYLGLVSYTQYKEMATAHLAKDMKYWLQVVKKWYQEGVDLVNLFEVGVANLLRDFSVCVHGAYSEEIEYLSGLPHDMLQQNLSTAKIGIEEIKYWMNCWSTLMDTMKSTVHQKAIWGVYATEVTHGRMVYERDVPTMS